MKKLLKSWRVLFIITLFSIQTAGAQPYDFKITTWNVEWLSCLSNGPSDRELQINNVVSMIRTMNSDMVALQEVGTSDLYKTIDTLVKRLGNEWGGQIVPWRVGNCNQSQGIVYKKSKIVFKNAMLITDGGTSYDWSSGRFPALYNVNFVVDNKPIPITFINIHAKAFADAESYNRRKNASADLKDALDASPYYSTTRMVIIGDFNDYLYGTTCNTCGGISPYKNFMDDILHYKGVTSNLTDPYYHNNPVIDNIIISNELFDDYLSNSAFREVSATQTIPNYYSTTSDHTPVSIIFRFSNDVNITENQRNAAFSVYPNPTNGELRIENGEWRMENVEIFDVFGRKISSHHLIPSSSHHLIPSSSHHLINISHLSAGIYFLKMGGETVKVIKY